jgi:hypothetical protein
MTLPSRDSVIWWLGMIGGAAAAIAAHLDLFPWLQPWAQHTVELVGFVWAVASGKFATSPLSGASKP